MFDFSGSNWPVSTDLGVLLQQTFDDFASAGNGWSGAERIAIASVARNGPESVDPGALPQRAVEVATQISTNPAGSTELSVRDAISEIGETRYVELVGVAAAMTAVDTITTLLGFGIVTLPESRPGDPVPDVAHPRLKRRSAWVAMDGPARPRHALSAAPRAQITMNRLIDRLYRPRREASGADEVRRLAREQDDVRGLSREQMEIVILKVSHSNECFW